MSEAFNVLRNRLINAVNAESVKDTIQQIERSRETGDISEQERDNLMDIANRNLDAKRLEAAEESEEE